MQVDRVLTQKYTVGGERDVVDARYGGQIPDQVRQVGAQQRFAAGEPQLPYAQGREQSR